MELKKHIDRELAQFGAIPDDMIQNIKNIKAVITDTFSPAKAPTPAQRKAITRVRSKLSKNTSLSYDDVLDLSDIPEFDLDVSRIEQYQSTPGSSKKKYQSDDDAEDEDVSGFEVSDLKLPDETETLKEGVALLDYYRKLRDDETDNDKKNKLIALMDSLEENLRVENTKAIDNNLIEFKANLPFPMENNIKDIINDINRLETRVVNVVDAIDNMISVSTIDPDDKKTLNDIRKGISDANSKKDYKGLQSILSAFEKKYNIDENTSISEGLRQFSKGKEVVEEEGSSPSDPPPEYEFPIKPLELAPEYQADLLALTDLAVDIEGKEQFQQWRKQAKIEVPMKDKIEGANNKMGLVQTKIEDDKTGFLLGNNLKMVVKTIKFKVEKKDKIEQQERTYFVVQREEPITDPKTKKVISRRIIDTTHYPYSEKIFKALVEPKSDKFKGLLQGKDKPNLYEKIILQQMISTAETNNANAKKAKEDKLESLNKMIGNHAQEMITNVKANLKNIDGAFVEKDPKQESNVSIEYSPQDAKRKVRYGIIDQIINSIDKPKESESSPAPQASLSEKPITPAVPDSGQKVEQSAKGIKSSRKAGSKQKGKGIIIAPTPDQLFERAKIIIGSIKAGNTSKRAKNELIEIMDYLLKNKHISKSYHKEIMKYL
jgi:hypothetical protein